MPLETAFRGNGLSLGGAVYSDYGVISSAPYKAHLLVNSRPLTVAALVESAEPFHYPHSFSPPKYRVNCFDFLRVSFESRKVGVQVWQIQDKV